MRVITYFPSTLADINEILGQEFTIVERSDKGAELIEEERFGYQRVVSPFWWKMWGDLPVL